MNSTEKSMVAFLIGEYGRCHQRLTDAERKIDELERRRNPADFSKVETLVLETQNQVALLEFYRGIEEDFWKEIRKKYGKGEFDPETFEYKIKPKNVRKSKKTGS
jgi:hypothetical protein